MTYFAVIVAGGKGLRMNSDLPKQFLLLRKKPVLMHTINRFSSALGADSEIVLVLPEDQIQYWKRLCVEHSFKVKHRVVAGGITRFESVKNGLSVCPDHGIVGIHDGVRPLISESLINYCFEKAKATGSALPVTPITQSLRLRNNERSKAMSRDNVVAVQTPQCFDISKIKSAYTQEFDPSFTDDATVFEGKGYEVTLVDGEATNLKITTPSDLKIAEAILSAGIR